jgi:hypothetical protein
MPFKALASLKKVGNLDAEVVAIAPLETDQLVGVVTNDPVKVALYPYASGTTKVKNVGLDNVGAIALINKTAAVVKTGGELWGVLDLQHTPKVEQVGRDIRALCHFPKGGTALALGWDGHGAALALEGREVGGRQFTLRGDVRTATLDSTHTFVVVNGVGGPGGQLRVHPGQTPENAATGRADLPSDATGLNRMSASQSLIVLAKRGADSVCVIRPRGNALEPNMLAVPGGVVDVAVIESSMFVVCADGKVRLYNSAMLARLGSDILEPTFQLDLRPKGEPTVIVASQRGGNKLWVGTKGGDVLRVDAVKGDLNIASLSS